MCLCVCDIQILPTFYQGMPTYTSGEEYERLVIVLYKDLIFK